MCRCPKDTILIIVTGKFALGETAWRPAKLQLAWIKMSLKDSAHLTVALSSRLQEFCGKVLQQLALMIERFTASGAFRCSPAIVFPASSSRLTS